MSDVFPREGERSFEITEASEITVTPDRVTVVPKQKDSAETLRNYKRNAWWFLALVGLSSTWFYRHFETYFSQGLVVGIPVAYAVWQVAFSYWRSFWEKNAQELRRKWLGQKSTTLQLIGLCAGVLLFLAGTSSVWISLAPGPIGAATVEVRYQGKRFMPRVELAETSRIGGRLFFPRFIPRRVELVVTSPTRWEIDGSPSRMLWPWTAIDLRFPDQFHERLKRALRIVPGTSLRDDVGIEDSPYTLTIEEGKAPPKNFPHYRFVTVYAGLAEWDELRASYRKHNTSAWGDLLERDLIANGATAEHAKSYASHWLTQSVIFRMHDFGDDSTVKVTLGIPGQPPIAETTSGKLTDEMTTLILEKR